MSQSYVLEFSDETRSTRAIDVREEVMA
jgi:hypothetical protein